MHQYFIFLFVLSVSSKQLSVYRKPVCNNDYDGFCPSSDIFRNEDSKRPEFCTKLNATCLNSECEQCKCQLNDAFVSYTHGCCNYETLQIIYNVSNCMKPEYGNDIPLSRQKTFETRICQPLSNVDNYIRPCSIIASSYLHLEDGERKYLNKTLFHLHQRRSPCIECKDFHCPLDEIAGMLLMFDVECKKWWPPDPVSTCFIMKVEGKQYVNETETTTHSSTVAVLIVIIVACVCLLLVAIVSAVLIARFRKKKLRRKQTMCAHFITDDVQPTIELPNPVYEEARLKAHQELSQTENVTYASTLALTNSVDKEGDNIYYQSADVGVSITENQNGFTGEDAYAYADSNITQRNEEVNDEYMLYNLPRDFSVNQNDASNVPINSIVDIQPNRPSNNFVVRPNTSLKNRYDEVGGVIETPKTFHQSYDEVGSVIPYG